MKKIIVYFSSVVLIAAIALACQKLDPTPQYTKSSATFTATASATSVSVAAADSLSDALTFTWTDPKYSVGLSKTVFTIMVDSAGKNFVNMTSKTFTNVLTGAFTGKEINEIAVKLGGIAGQPMTLDMKVMASLENSGAPQESSVVQVSVTPFSSLSLSADSLTVVCTAANAGDKGSEFTWTPAFQGFNGPVTYQLQYAKTKTNFASPTSVSQTSFSKVFTKLDLNKITGAVGYAPGTQDTVDFRIQATNGAGKVMYSNTVTMVISSFVAYNSIGIIGDGTPGGWGTDTDMYRADPINDPAAWTVTLYLTGGKSAKFRADDDWANNWGDTAFPSGTGSSGGQNIPISNSGYYQVNFNAGTGAYSFTALTTTDFTASGISVIGDATPGGWGADTPLTQSNTDPNVWTGTVAMTSGGSFKFRKTGDWGTNWGPGYASSTGQSGWGVNNGGNISVTLTTSYFVYINTATGQYFFGDATNNPGAGTPYTSIGVIGDGTPGGWGADTNLIQNPANPYLWSAKIPLTAAFAKFRADGGWTINWGGKTFPGGVGTQGGDNIAVNAGTAQITFNSATGEYYFAY
ncbi:MAG: SusE domain-containing protein [Bacteroidetes bacterium]|nr:SusE domain-containing protein [Bacteroidota bacterium]